MEMDFFSKKEKDNPSLESKKLLGNSKLEAQKSIENINNIDKQISRVGLHDDVH